MNNTMMSEEYIETMFKDFMEMTSKIAPSSLDIELHTDVQKFQVLEHLPDEGDNVIGVYNEEVPMKIVLKSNHRTITITY